MTKYKHSLLYTSVMLALSYPAYAENTVEQLDEVIVSGSSFSQQIGTQKITEEQIKRRPTKNGGITDLLKSNPNVRFSNNADLSTNAGEIRPNEVSFHGEKYYGNNFILDGMSNNDNINPSGNIERNGEPIGSNPYDLPNGNTQSMWIDASLLKSVEAFDSNISAKYGNFTGGVINAELKDPSFERRTGKIYYRTTRDDWTHFYIQEGREEAFNKATRLDFHPRFVKQTFGLHASEKLADNFAILFSYKKNQSKIDYAHSTMRYTANLDQPIATQQKRTNETYLLRGVYLPENGDLWRGTVIYSPHSAKLFRSNTENSSYTSVGGGIQANLEWEKRFDWGQMKSYLGYKKTGDTIDYDEENYHRFMSSDNLNWTSNGTYSQYGGYGKVYTQNEIYTVKQDYSLTPFDWANMEHKVIFGWNANLSKAKYQRDNTNALYYYTKNTNIICGTASACISGDQYANSRNVYSAKSVHANDNDYAAYLEDTIKWKRLELSLGAHLNHNQFLGNTNLAHRISASYDIWGNGDTTLFGGINRYYGRSMLAFKLRQGIGEANRETRTLNSDGSLSDWEVANISNAPTKYLMTKVKTPYSDEQVLGLSQKLYGTKWTFKWVHRNSRDQLSSDLRVVDGSAYRVLNNNGWSKNDTFTLSVSPVKEHQFKHATIGWDVGVRISRQKTNNKWYDTSAYANQKAIYNNQLIDAVDLPPSDFNTPWSATANLHTSFPSLNLSWDQSFSYTRGKKQRTSDSEIACNGAYTGGRYASICGDYIGNATLYEDLETGSMFNVDWRFTYTQPTFQNQFFEITLDVNNVLNKKALSKSSSGTSVYKQGRNFWLGASYNW
ncbi:TonB-dependent receptor [Actinobacillus porcitonsillarum]|uniref:TonB-dependent receptor n=1 Tax=Actinobacillus porcitonsillarum TaxID=189834 RepID=A0A2U8FHC4_9PAST|nr:TonB-dependent receptor plug domain-containing protein [Actinobacillus porcitonsillarum]AWI50352.1 TonB-dependent receptor [Actinobacillus porcitonsillarum]